MVINMIPYVIIEKEITDTFVIEIRLFEDFKANDLFWHRDAEDRLISIIEGDALIQLEDEMPQQIGTDFFVPKETFHRILATNNFKLQVKKLF